MIENVIEIEDLSKEYVRDEFLKSWPAETQEAKATAYRRSLKDGVAKQLIVSRTNGGRTLIWKLDPKPGRADKTGMSA